MRIVEDSQNNPFDNMKLDDSHCFLCGFDMGEMITAEHVFPKWLLNKYGLWDEKAHLLNETLIPYKNLTVPCCASCNNEHLAKLEGEIRCASERGYDGIAELDELKLYQWTAKLYYGLLRKELTLKYERSDPNSSTIVDSSALQNLKMMHLVMQSVRRPIVFPSGQPFSVLVVNMHNPSSIGDFDFGDSSAGHAIKVKLGEVGFIVAFEDGALNESSYGNYLRAVSGRKLHPIQFDELYAKVIYQNIKMDSGLYFVLGMPLDESKPVSIDAVGYVRAGDWDQKEFAEILYRLCKVWIDGNGLTWNEVYKSPDRVVTWMSDSNNELMILDENGDRVNES